MKQETIHLDPKIFDQLTEVAHELGICRSKICRMLITQVVQTLNADEIKHACEDIGTLIMQKKITQKDAMLHLLRQRPNGISSKLAKVLGITKPSYPVHVLREDGHNIESKWAYADNRRNRKNNYKIFTLICD